MTEVDFKRLEGTVSDETKELDHAHHHAFIEMAETFAPDHLFEKDPIPFLEQFALGSV